MIVGVLIAWLGAVASFGILTFAALFLGAFFAGRVAGARTARQWAVAALLTVGGFTLLWLVARQGTV
ncbi:MAG: hypothetical protein FJ038_07915 [Chloroflexi bacterium]|nr:hypothetical protein [Chloroflexota bacterium]